MSFTLDLPPVDGGGEMEERDTSDCLRNPAPHFVKELQQERHVQRVFELPPRQVGKEYDPLAVYSVIDWEVLERSFSEPPLAQHGFDRDMAGSGDRSPHDHGCCIWVTTSALPAHDRDQSLLNMFTFQPFHVDPPEASTA